MKAFSFTNLLIATVLTFMAGGCINNSSRLELLKCIKAINEQCPISNEAGMLTHIDVQNNLIMLNYTIDKGMGYDISKMMGHEELFSELFVHNLVSNRLLGQDELTNLIITSGYGMQVIYHDATGNDQMQFTVSNDELKLAKQNPVGADRILELGVAATKLQLPTVVDETTTFTDLKLTGDRLTYIYDVDDEQVDINLMNAATAEIRKETETILRTNENTIIGLYSKMARQSGRGLTLVYHGTLTGKDIVIDFSNDELRTIAGDYVISE